MLSKKFLSIFFLMCYFLSTHATIVSLYPISKENALVIAKRQFANQDVDYYILNEDTKQNWTIFVDAHPLENWTHECFLLTIPKNSVRPTHLLSPSKIEAICLFPEGEYQPLEVKMRDHVSTYRAPYVTVDDSILYRPDVQRTYAIILSGGGSAKINHERYWNDCSFIYQTLTKRYGVPKSHVFPIMSDGANPAADMNRKRNGRSEEVSQSLDLDFDGEDEISLAATNANVSNTLSQILPLMNRNDHLLFYVIDHGYPPTEAECASILMWQYQKLYDYQLGEMLSPFCHKGVNVNVVLGQCHAGYFIDDLNEIGCVVSTACGEKSSYGSGDYDEFVHLWTCALNGRDHENRPLRESADYNHDGFVSMEEAFKYTKKYDKIGDDPHYCSTPLYVGERLAVDRIAEGYDLFIQDSPEDEGIEPNNVTSTSWESHAIWLRNNDDNGLQHQNPSYSDSHKVAYVKVRIHNRGKDDYTGGKWLQVYWSQASTACSANSWEGKETYNDQYQTGGKLLPKYIHSIRANTDTVITVEWLLPDLMRNFPENNCCFNLYAIIQDSPYGYNKEFSPLECKNEAQSSKILVDKGKFNKFFNVYIRNVSSQTKTYSLDLITKELNCSLQGNSGLLEFELDDRLFQAWQSNGCLGSDIQISNRDSSLCRVKTSSENASLKGITLNPNESVMMKVRFLLSNESPSNFNYIFDLIQRDENGQNVGGLTFIIEGISIVTNPIVIITTPIGDGHVELSANSSDYTSILNWKDEYGNIIGDSPNVMVLPSITDNRYFVTAMTEDGLEFQSEISLIDTFGIQSIEYVGQMIKVLLRDTAPDNSYVKLFPTHVGNEIIQPIVSGTQVVNINITDVPNGLYKLGYFINSNLIDIVGINIINQY